MKPWYKQQEQYNCLYLPEPVLPKLFSLEYNASSGGISMKPLQLFALLQASRKRPTDVGKTYFICGWFF